MYRPIVGIECFLPLFFCGLRVGLLALRPFPEQGVATVVVGLLLQGKIVAFQCLAKGGYGLVMEIVLVGRGSKIILELRIVGMLFQRRMIEFRSLQIIAAAVGIFGG